MSGWNTEDMAEALPTVENPVAGEGEVTAVKKNPQEAGWVKKEAYNYEAYNKSAKELIDENAANGVGDREWASNAAKYEWNDDFGDVGPPFPELEQQLFGSEHHVKAGIDFSKYVMFLVNGRYLSLTNSIQDQGDRSRTRGHYQNPTRSQLR